MGWRRTAEDKGPQQPSDHGTSKWFDKLDTVIGHRPSLSGTATTRDSAVALLESIVADNQSSDGNLKNLMLWHAVIV